MKLSPHFSLAEFTRSNTAARLGISNTPPKALLPRLKQTAEQMELVREICGGRPVIVYSGYRCPELNEAVGGSITSSHKEGEAVDFKVQGLSILEAVVLIRESGIKFDQLIDEFGGWVHIGFGRRARRQVLSARKVGGRTVYKAI